MLIRNIGIESFDDPISPFCRLNLATDSRADLPVEINQLGIDRLEPSLAGGSNQPDDLGKRRFALFRCTEIRRLGPRWHGSFPVAIIANRRVDNRIGKSREDCFPRVWEEAFSFATDALLPARPSSAGLVPARNARPDRPALRANKINKPR